MTLLLSPTSFSIYVYLLIFARCKILTSCMGTGARWHMKIDWETDWLRVSRDLDFLLIYEDQSIH